MIINLISKEIKDNLSNYTSEDNIVFNNKIISINKDNFEMILPSTDTKTIAFIDGGQAEIISAGNFCLSFIRVEAVVFQNNKNRTNPLPEGLGFEPSAISHNKKIKNIIKEFYVLSTAKYENNDLFYYSRLFFLNDLDNKLVDEDDLSISSTDASIRTGSERAPISKAANMARRFAELSLAAELSLEVDFVVVDGTLEKTFLNEEKYLERLNKGGKDDKGNVCAMAKVCALAKSSALFTTSGNSPVVLLNKIGLEGCWSYFVDGNSDASGARTYFVKLHKKAKHVFRFEGHAAVLPYLLDNCQDALFLGYPYGLIIADKLARVSNAEKSSLRMRFLLDAKNKEIVKYLHSSDAHDILDTIG